MPNAYTTRITGAGGSTGANGFHVDTRDLRALNAALRKAEPEAALKAKQAMIAAGDIVKDKAKEIVSPYSKSIPRTIKTQAGTGLSLSVRAGGKNVPIAALYELGNKGGSKSQTLRHPVFGDMNNWVEQPRHPFLRPALAATSVEVEAAVLKAADELVQTIVRWGARW